jgi:hypothetical protein
MIAALAVPLAASVITLGAPSASATPSVVPDILSATCHTGQVCFFADINFAPSGEPNQVLEYTVTHSDWSSQDDPAHVCGGIITHTWNDCASSVKNRTQDTMYLWTDAHCTGSRHRLNPGASIADLRSIGMNDQISSDRVNNGAPNC